MPDLKQYKPDYYDGVLEMDSLLEAQQPDVDELWLSLNTLDQPNPDSLPNRGLMDNQFIQTADAGRLAEEEALYNIVAAPTDTLAFRRIRLLNRKGLLPPFSEPWIRRQLDNLIGAGNYTLTITGSTYTINLESSATDQAYFHEVAATFAYIKPCNMLFINQPLISPTVIAAEEIYLLSRVYNYHLGTTWNLGEKPFSSFLNNPPHYEYILGDGWQLGANPFATYNGELIKLASQPSIQPIVFNTAATVTAGDIAAVRINGTILITAFVLKTAIGSQVTIEYNVMPTDTATITLVELLDASNNVLTSSAVYITVVLGVLMTHRINFKEGN